MQPGTSIWYLDLVPGTLVLWYLSGKSSPFGGQFMARVTFSTDKQNISAPNQLSVMSIRTLNVIVVSSHWSF